MAPPSWIRLPRATLILILLALHLFLSVAAQFECFDSDELPHAAAADLASPDDDKGLDLDVDLPPRCPSRVHGRRQGARCTGAADALLGLLFFIYKI
jgi:hypothetical protein